MGKDGGRRTRLPFGRCCRGAVAGSPLSPLCPLLGKGFTPLGRVLALLNVCLECLVGTWEEKEN